MSTPTVEIVLIPRKQEAGRGEGSVEEEILSGGVTVIMIFCAVFLVVLIAVAVVMGNAFPERERKIRSPLARNVEPGRGTIGAETVISEISTVSERHVDKVPSMDVRLVLKAKRVEVAPPPNVQIRKIKSAVDFLEFTVDGIVVLVFKYIVDDRPPESVAKLKHPGELEGL